MEVWSRPDFTVTWFTLLAPFDGAAGRAAAVSDTVTWNAGVWIAMTIPEQPRSRGQRYRLTAEGTNVLVAINIDGSDCR